MSKLFRIGITGCAKFANYEAWVRSSGRAEPVRLEADRSQAADVADCDGVLLTGGQDVHPELYGRPEQVKCFGLTDLLPGRDAFEFEVIRVALAARKPLLGICRGLQLMNVFFGGTLVPDIPTVMNNAGHGKTTGHDQSHEISVLNPSKLFEITGKVSGKVNSAHHQAAARTGRDLRVTAVAEGGIAEAMEWAAPEDKSWLLLVQWHPERMTDKESPFSAGILHSWLEACSARGYAHA